MDRDFAEKINSRRKKKICTTVAFVVIFLIGIISLFWYKQNGGFNGKGEQGKVYIEIRCDQLASNLDALNDEAIRNYIPEDGIILLPTEVDIIKGVTNVFDVTDYVVKENDIQIEYSYVPAYGSHYIEGINYIYEFSAGKNSGWIFMVDGEVPNYGADAVTLKGGERIVWYYTVDYKEDM